MKELNIEILKSKKAILFDSDGTLLDNSNIWNEIYAEFVFKKCGVRISVKQALNDWHEHHIKFKGEDLFKSYVLFLTNKYGNKKYDADILRKELYEIADEFVISKVKYKDYAPEVVKKFKSLNYILGLGTLCDRETFEKYNCKNLNITKKMNCFNEFNKILLYEDVSKRKPNPEIYLKLLNELNLNPEECLIIEDSLTGVQAGRMAGIEVLNIPDECSIMHQQEIDNITDYKLQSMKELYEILVKV